MRPPCTTSTSRGSQVPRPPRRGDGSAIPQAVPLAAPRRAPLPTCRSLGQGLLANHRATPHLCKSLPHQRIHCRTSPKGDPSRNGVQGVAGSNPTVHDGREARSSAIAPRSGTRIRHAGTRARSHHGRPRFRPVGKPRSTSAAGSHPPCDRLPDPPPPPSGRTVVRPT